MNLSPKARVLGGAWLLAALVGCGSGLSGVDKRLSALQEEITKLQNQNDHLIERVDAVEARQANSERAKPAQATPGTSERPSLKVVKVVPEDTTGMPSPQVGTPAPGEAADDPSPRPLIKLRGGGSSGKASEKSDG